MSVSETRVTAQVQANVPESLGQALLAECEGVAVGPGDVLYVYDERQGVYVEGEETLKRMAQRLLGPASRTNRIAEGLAWLRLHDGVPRLWERPSDSVLNLKNGLLHLSPAKQLKPHAPDVLTTVRLNVAFDPHARCPRIDKFLSDALPADVIPVFHEITGYLLTPDTSQKKSVMLIGPTDSGKSTALDLWEALLGTGNVSHVSLHDLCESRFSTAQLVGKLANLYSDLDARSLRHPAVFKVLTGRDALTVERKYGQPFDYRPFTRHAFAANKPPPPSDNSSAYFNRWLILPFQKSVPREHQDLELIDKMTTPGELSGLLNLALEGLDRLRRKGNFTASGSVRRAGRRYRGDADPIYAFLKKVVKRDPDGRVARPALFRQWEEHCGEKNIAVGTATAFNKHIRDTLPYVKEGTGKSGDKEWRGLAWIQ